METFINGQIIRQYLFKYKLSYEQMIELEFPVQKTENPDLVETETFRLNSEVAVALLSSNGFDSSIESLDILGIISDEKCADINIEDINQQICVRCGRFFFITDKEYITRGLCSYHYGTLIETYESSPCLKHYTCCNGDVDSAGCWTATFHVWNGFLGNIDNSDFASTQNYNFGFPTSYSLDCKMVHTVAGLEAARVSVVDYMGCCLYDRYIKTDNTIVDFDTIFSGILEYTYYSFYPITLMQVQYELCQLIHGETLLIGYGLGNALKALKLHHDHVIDLTVMFPHENGLPHKYTLTELAKINLNQYMEEFDPVDCCRTCMSLVLDMVIREIECDQF